MDAVTHIKQFVAKYYPKDHLYLAGGLTLFFVLFLLYPGWDDGAGVNNIDDKGAAVPHQSVSIPVNTGPAPPPATTDTPLTSAASATARSDTNPNLEAFVVPAEHEPPALADITVWQNVEVRSGDNLSTIFSRVGLTDQDVYRVLNSSDEAKILNRLYPGYQLDFRILTQGELEQLRVLKNPLEGYLFTRYDSGFEVEPIVKQAEIRQSFKVGTISDSLFMAGQREQIPALHIMEMANVFGGVIDFILDPRQGDQFSILYQEKYLDGEFIGYGEILATQYVNEGRVFTAVRYVDAAGEAGYYNPEGESMRKAFLRNPLDVFRISSNFNPSRRHPILNTIRAHKGTDYAAPTGTPVRATSDGRVTWAARNGSFGNLVTVKHDGGFETKYAHLSRYANGIRKGARVRQGDVIGYVGATGGATGPHLHYEFLMNGVHQNPRTVHEKLPKARSIEPEELGRFKDQTAGLMQHFTELNSNWVLTLNNRTGAD